MANGLDPRRTPVQRFGKELARTRRDHGPTQVALGRRLGCSSSLVAHIEKGDRTPKPDLAAACDQAFGTGDRFSRLCRSITSPSGPGWYLRWTDEIEPCPRAQELGPAPDPRLAPDGGLRAGGLPGRSIWPEPPPRRWRTASARACAAN
ncbi:XRE family transcriptional regulator [Nonomuraea diastatica]|uniref:XRE family transcriptional regulator n=1 Tax=Nonomuraea diastatica TaxID=1848329 RepID=A0A4R4WJN6_9ACTN|nr:XRE family transcriptional regulator [Nonomuraea diastatica]